MLVLEHSRVMRGKKIILIATDGLTKELCIRAYLFSKTKTIVRRKEGFLFTALYLKQCASSPQIAYGGVRPLLRDLSLPISLTRSGFPQIIPPFHRRMIYLVCHPRILSDPIFPNVLTLSGRLKCYTDGFVECNT